VAAGPEARAAAKNAISRTREKEKGVGSTKIFFLKQSITHSRAS